MRSLTSLAAWLMLVSLTMGQSLDERSLAVQRLVAERYSEVLEMQYAFGSGEVMSADRLTLASDGEASIGDPTAETRIIVYASLECRACDEFFDVATRLHEDLEMAGKPIQVIFRLAGSKASTLQLNALIYCAARGRGGLLTGLYRAFVQSPPTTAEILLGVLSTGRPLADECRRLRGHGLRCEGVRRPGCASRSCDLLSCKRWIDQVEGAAVSIGGPSVPLFIVDLEADDQGPVAIDRHGVGTTELAKFAAELLAD